MANNDFVINASDYYDVVSRARHAQGEQQQYEGIYINYYVAKN